MLPMVLCAAAICSAVMDGHPLVIWGVLSFAAGMAVSREARAGKDETP